MTTAHNPHTCYTSGPRHPECAAVVHRYMKQLRLDHARGERRRRDATQTVHHIERLHNNGWTTAQISRASGLGEGTIRAVASQLHPEVSNTTARAILSLPPGPPPTDSPTVDATGTMRRLQALAAIGYSSPRLAELLGTHRSVIGRISRNEQPTVHAATAEAVARAYRRLSRVPGGNVRARNDARRRGWHSPAAWDGAAIDDPRAVPEADARPREAVAS